MAHRILVADDEAASRRGLKALLRNAGYEVEEAADGQEALEKASTFLPAVVITDLVMPRLDGLALLSALQGALPWASVIILTGHGSIETAVTAMKQGAYDYLSKPVDIPRLRLLVEKALERGATAREVAALRRQLRAVWGSGSLIGASQAMQEVYRLIDLAAPTTAPVLIVGESGTGKELVARRLHELSPRSTGAFVAVNCSAIPETLLESEIFGHERGAFTGALERRAGCFELAHGGTLLLDEVAEMAPGTQAKFLRILQDGTVRRLGGKSELQVDVRVIAATNRDPAEAIRDGKLREDLYYRLNVVTIAITPLRTRRDDIPLLVEAFIQEFNSKYSKRVRSVDEATLRWLVERPWPGNVRELRNAVERAIIVCEGELIGVQHLPAAAAAPPPSRAAGGDAVVLPVGTTVDEAERQLIVRTLASVGNNKARAAEVLGISLKTLHNKLHRYAEAE
jgi:DNA-binding NtrC family response regulator